jgi:hypothetical protein
MDFSTSAGGIPSKPHDPGHGPGKTHHVATGLGPGREDHHRPLRLNLRKEQGTPHHRPPEGGIRKFPAREGYRLPAGEEEVPHFPALSGERLACRYPAPGGQSPDGGTPQHLHHPAEPIGENHPQRGVAHGLQKETEKLEIPTYNIGQKGIPEVS